MPTSNVRAWLDTLDISILVANGFEAALLGYAVRVGQPEVAIYDYQKCIEVLMQRDSMTYEEATEFFDFNVLGAWVGEATPLFLFRPPEAGADA
jgi:hypothetical protein